MNNSELISCFTHLQALNMEIVGSHRGPHDFMGSYVCTSPEYSSSSPCGYAPAALASKRFAPSSNLEMSVSPSGVTMDILAGISF